MSRTLFLYIFKDLFRIFMLTSGVLSAIMNFGGLLRPLYEYGLGLGQVAQILLCAGPATIAYSLPIAALFATTIVYGRLGADNEITACRAAGLSYLAMTVPAFVLGLLTAFISIGLLCFFVPASMLRVEKIVYSNIAQLAASQIERTHQIHFGDITVFAQSATVLPIDPQHPDDQAVQFDGPVIAEYEKTEGRKPLIPRKFYIATTATALIQQDSGDDDLKLTIYLHNGATFPRVPYGKSKDNAQVSVGEQSFGPVPLPSPIKENSKFMDVRRLQYLLEHPEQSRRVETQLKEFVRDYQKQEYLKSLATKLNGPANAVQFDAGTDKFKLERGPTTAEVQKDTLVLSGDDESPVRFEQIAGTQSPPIGAAEVRVRAFPNSERRQISLEIEMSDCLVVEKDTAPIARKTLSHPITVPMPASIASLMGRPMGDYIGDNGMLSASEQLQVKREFLKLKNSLISEQYARMSFAVSCLVLVMVGCALGMMFRSGNFLSAFAVSVIPALLSIALVVTGQHTCENVPSPLPPNWQDPLYMGLALIWSGNAAVCAIAVVLLGRLQRQ